MLTTLLSANVNTPDERGQVCWLMEPKPRNKTSNLVETFYWSSASMLPFAPDDPDRPNIWYNPVLKDPGQFGRYLYQKGTIDDSEPRTEDGGVIVFNADNEFNAIRTGYAVDAREVAMYRGRDSYGSFDQFTQFTVATMAKAFFNIDKSNIATIEISLTDKSQTLNTNYQTTLYAGTNSGATGVEGLAADIAGTPKERSFGPCFNAPATPVNTSDLTFSLNAGFAIDSVSAIRDNGVNIAVDTTPDYATLALLKAASITAARYATCLAEGFFRLGSSPAGLVTADFIGTKVTNLYLQSQTLATTWTIARASIVSNTTTAPDGTSTADTLMEDTQTGVHLVTQSPTVVVGKTYWASVYAKAGTRTKIVLFVDAKSRGFDLDAGTMYSSTADGSTDAIDYRMDDAGDGWYRCSIKYVAGDAAASTNIYLDNGVGTTASYVGDGASYAYLWGAQLTRSDGIEPYVVTTTAAASSTPKKCDEIIRYILEQKGYSYGTYSHSDFATINSACPYELTLFIGQATTIWDLISGLANSPGCAWYHDRLGVFRLKLLTDPDSGSPELEIVENDLVNVTRILPKGDIGFVPSYRTTLGYQKAWAVQGSDSVAGSVSAANRALYSKEFRDAPTAADTAVQADHFNAFEYKKQTLIYTKANADTEAARLQAIFAVYRDFLQIEVDYDDDIAMLDLLDCITLTSDKAGYGAGKKALIIGISENYPRPGRRLLELFL